MVSKFIQKISKIAKYVKITFYALLFLVFVSVAVTALRNKEKIMSDVEGTFLSDYIQPGFFIKILNPGIKFIEDFYPFRPDPKFDDFAIEKWIIRLSNKSIAGLNEDLAAMDQERKNGRDFRQKRRWHKAVLVIDGRERPCKMRWRGSYRHWMDDKKSIKIEFKWENPFRQMKEMHLMIPYDRGWLTDYCFNWLARKEGLLTLKNQYCFLFINNQAHGVYYVVEDPSFLTLDRNNRPRGPIFKPRRAKGADYEQEYYVYSHLEKIDKGDREALLELADIDNYLRYSAISAVFGTHHNENYVYYLNPGSRKIEPIPFDTNANSLSNGLDGFDAGSHPIIKNLLKEPELNHKRNIILYNIIKYNLDKMLENYNNKYIELKKPIESDKNKHHSNYVTKWLIEDYYKKIIKNNVKIIESQLNGQSQINLGEDIIRPLVICKIIKEDEKKVKLVILNKFNTSIKIDNLGFANSKKFEMTKKNDLMNKFFSEKAPDDVLFRNLESVYEIEFSENIKMNDLLEIEMDFILFHGKKKIDNRLIKYYFTDKR